MKPPSVPSYKPPPELQELLNQQATQRKRTAQLPKRNWINRNPRLFQVVFLSTTLLALFSRPIYDALFEESFPAVGDTVRVERRK